MKHLCTYTWVLFVVLFMAWYVPVSFVNVLSCDDFWLGNTVSKFGFWGAQIYFYRMWEGSYYHSFLATVPHVFNVRHMPFFVNMSVLLLFIVSVWFFIRSYNSMLSRKRSAFYSIILAVFYYVTTCGGAEIRFWVCANASYIAGISTLLIFLSLYHKLRNWTTINLLSIWFCLFLICGHKLTYITCLFLCMLIHDFVFKTFCRKRFVLIYLPLLLFTLINIMAPGNYLRLNENISDGRSYTIGNVIAFRLKDVVPMLLWAFVLPPCTMISDSQLQSRKTIGVVMLGAMAFFLLESFLMYFCFGDPGPKRTYVLSEIWFLSCGLIARDKLLSLWKFDVKDLRLYGLVIGLCLCVHQLNFIRHVPATIAYANKAQMRNIIMKSAKNSTTILIPELPPSHLLLNYFANDLQWLKNVYAPYFHKYDCDIQLLKQ